MAKVLITGITGQDGAYLAKLALSQGHHVLGTTRRKSEGQLSSLKYLGIADQVEVHGINLNDPDQTMALIVGSKPDAVYNLTSLSSVALSFQKPMEAMQSNILPVISLLEAIKLKSPGTRFFQTSSSEMFGNAESLPVTENSPKLPVSPYGSSKLSAHLIVDYYRRVHGLHASTGIMFNHESFLRPQNFFIKKILNGAIKIKKGFSDKLLVGNLNVKRDFGYAPKYVEAMTLICNHKTPDDFIVCSGQSILLREIVEHVFKRLSLDPSKIVEDKSLSRPGEIFDIYGNNSKIRANLGWDYEMSFINALDLLLEEELRAESI